VNPDLSGSSAPYKILNIGNQTPVELLDFITEIENNLVKKAVKNFLPMQPGDVPQNVADVSELVADYGYRPSTPVKTGVKAFVDWYLDFYIKRP
jgi:UDP-glucuronate 4-epimerase